MITEHAHGFLGRVASFLAGQQFLLLFVVVGVGYALGRVRLRGFGLGATASTILLGLLISTAVYRAGAKIAYPALISNMFFYLFLFAVGIRIGPQFWFGVKQGGAKLVILGVVTAVLGPLLAWLCGALFDLPAGSVVGLLGGALTSTPTLGGAQSALASNVARIPEGMTAEQVEGNLSTAFAITYVFGMAGYLLFQKYLPKLFRADVERAAHEFEERAGGSAPAPGTAEALAISAVPAVIRVYRVESEALVERPLGVLRERYPRGAVLRVERDGRVLQLADDLVLRRGDKIAVAGRVEHHVERASIIGPELPERADLRAETAEVVVTKQALVGRSIAELQRTAGHGLYLNGLFRGGDEVPATLDTVLRKGDVLRVTGVTTRIESLAEVAGAVVRSDLSTDIVFLTAGLAIGALLGAIEVPVGRVRLSLGIGGGLLLTGLFISVWRTRRPQLGGPFPEPARRLIEDLGLNVFVAVLGLNAGPQFLEALSGGTVIPLLLAALVVGLLPAIVVWVIGAYAMKMNRAVLLGAVAGSCTNSAGMRVAEEDTHSTVPAIGFPVPYAIGTILFTLAGYVLMLF